MEILLRSEKIGLSGRESGLRHLALLPLRFDCDLTDGAGLPEFFIPLRLSKCVILARPGIDHLRFGDFDRRFRPADRRFKCRDARIKVYRVHFGQGLAGSNLITHINKNPADTSRAGGADLVGETRFDSANAEQRR